MNRNQKLLEIAAEKTMERIHADHEKAPPRIKPLLAYLEEHLFEPQLDFNQLKKACNIRDNTIPIQFHTSVGLPPYAYIEDCRLETACRLLRDTDLKVWQITQLLGYSSIQVFSRAFGRWSGMRPTAYRKKERKKMGTPPPPRNADVFTEGDRPIRVETVRKGLQGHLDDDEAFGVVMHLLRIYPEAKLRVRTALGGGVSGTNGGGPTSFGAGAAGVFDPLPCASSEDSHRVGKIQAEELWYEVKQRQPDEQRRLVVDGIRLRSPDMFHLLRAKSRELGRLDRARGVHMGELAILSLSAVQKEHITEKQMATLEAQGLAWLSHRYRLSGDPSRAQELLNDAEDRLPARPGRLARLDILLARAALAFTEGRYDEAMAVQKKAVSLARKEGADDLLAQSLILEGQALRRLEKTERAMESLQEALDRLEDGGDVHLRGAALHCLAKCCLDSGDVATAADLLPVMLEAAESLEHRDLRMLGRGLEGLVARGEGRSREAEHAFADAIDAFSGDGNASRVALVSLDLADLYAEQGRTDEVVRVTSQLVPVLDRLKTDPEAVTAARLLEGALAEKSLSQDILRQARTVIAGISARA